MGDSSGTETFFNMQTNQQLLRRENGARDENAVAQPRWLDYPYGDPAGPGAASDSMRLSAILRRYRYPLLGIFSFFILGSLLWVKCSEVTYQSKILLEVMGLNQDFLSGKGLNPNSPAGAEDSYVATQTKLLMTDEVIDRTAKVLGPTVPADVLNRASVATRVRRLFGMKAKAAPETGEQVVEQMLHSAKVKPEGEASLISVTVEGPDPKLTADAANTLADQYVQQIQESRWNAASRTGDFLRTQLDGMRKKLQASEDAMQNYARSVGLIYTDASRESVAAERLRSVQQDLARAEADLDDKQSQIELLKNSVVDALPKVYDDGALREYKSRMADLQRQKADLLVSYSPKHYKVQHVQSQIEELQAEMDRERKTIVGRIQNDYNASKRRTQLLSDSYHKQLATVSDQSLAQVKYNMLQHEVDASREVYQTMLQRVKEATVMSAVRASSVRVANAARPAAAPYSPNMAKHLGVGLLGAIMCSILFVLIRERSNRSIRNPGESIKLIAVPELGVIPSAKFPARDLSQVPRRRLLPIAGVPESSSTVPVAITSWQGNESLVKESIRSVVTSLVMYGESFYRNRIILMTSPHPQAGKTTAVSNLGLALAESGRKVLIIDGDLRRPRLSSLFDVQDEIGLAELLGAGPEQKNLQVEASLRATAYPNLYILPSGDASTDLPRLLHSPRLEEVLSSVRNQFDFILLDSPPMMALTDARLLSRNTDGVILVCRSGKTTGEQLAFSYRRLAEDGIEVIGTILNDWNPRSEDPSYFNSYSDYARTSRK
jgi:succinoglycan biosynthesis transport protein ExoP